MKFTKIKTIHTKKFEIHKSKTLDKKKPRQTPDAVIIDGIAFSLSW